MKLLLCHSLVRSVIYSPKYSTLIYSGGITLISALCIQRALLTSALRPLFHLPSFAFNKIPNPKKLGKQDLIYKILDSQAIAGAKGAKPADDGKRKRIIKTNTSTGGSEEAVVESGDEAKPIIKKPIMAVKKDDLSTGQAGKTPIKRARKKPEEKEVVVETANEIQLPVQKQPRDAQPTGEKPGNGNKSNK